MHSIFWFYEPPYAQLTVYTMESTARAREGVDIVVDVGRPLPRPRLTLTGTAAGENVGGWNAATGVLEGERENTRDISATTVCSCWVRRPGAAVRVVAVDVEGSSRCHGRSVWKAGQFTHDGSSA